MNGYSEPKPNEDTAEAIKNFIRLYSTVLVMLADTVRETIQDTTALLNAEALLYDKIEDYLRNEPEANEEVLHDLVDIFVLALHSDDQSQT
ncbi:MAG: hypothetical protein F4X56_10675 [Gammaproteobacteria bacterium]|nr:hypothetical protein [Gammaproteobacteria bacterium]